MVLKFNLLGAGGVKSLLHHRRDTLDNLKYISGLLVKISLALPYTYSQVINTC